jgi:hypothetical protein
VVTSRFNSNEQDRSVILSACKSRERVLYKKLNSTGTLIQKTIMGAPQGHKWESFGRRLFGFREALHQRDIPLLQQVPRAREESHGPGSLRFSAFPTL